ncbi:hypothetical protein ABH926_007036 [Catenulispora sp. GP43]|uniref:hypothetical protein n=1 Tax=Catenulispora sp. GP43 TaxID=3156263 RepID=UPI003517B997
MEDTKGMTRRQLIVSSAGAVIAGGAAAALLGETATAQAAPNRSAASDTALAAATFPTLDVTTSWVGNTYAGATQWMQDFLFNIAVTADGTVYTNSFWDEGGDEAGIYKDGKLVGNSHSANGDAVAVNSKNAFLTVGNGLTAFSPAGVAGTVTFAVGSPPAAAAATDTQVIATDRVQNRVVVFDAATGTIIRSWAVNQPGAVAIDPKSGDVWVVSGVTRDTNDGHFWHPASTGPVTVLGFTNTGTALPGTIAGPAPTWLPTCLAVDVNGDLLVGDNGPLRQVHTYTGLSSAKPTLAKSLGRPGGIGSGTPGVPDVNKLWGISGVGGDSAGNVYVGMNEYGTWLRKYNPAGDLVWQLVGQEFVTSGDFDPASGALDIYSPHAHYRMDYNKAPGSDSTWLGYTLDSVKYPQDPRLFMIGHQHHITSVFMRRFNNNLYMYSTGMYSGELVVHKMAGEIAVPSAAIFKAHFTDAPNWPPFQPAAGEWIWRDANGDGVFTADEYTVPGTGASAPSNCWVWFVDAKGDVWEGGDRNLRRYPLQGFDSHGNPIYDYAHMVTTALPAPFKPVRRLYYDLAADVMYVSGYTADQPFENAHWKECGKVLASYDKWSTLDPATATPTWQVLLPWDETVQPVATTPVSWQPAGEYIFVCGIATRGLVWVLKAADGSPVGMWEPSAIVGPPSAYGPTGWVDIPYGLNAAVGADGTYHVTVEDDLKNKILVYSWKP